MDCCNATQNLKKMLGKRIKELRIKKGLSQERLAEKIGIGQRNLSKIECGTNFVTAETLSGILKAFEVEAKELFDFNHLDNETVIKEKLIKAINNNSVDIRQMYRFYQITKV